MSEIERRRKERSRKAEKIIADPGEFKICEGCESIVAERVSICPNCYGYRFNAELETVIAHARLLGSREQQSVVADDLT